MSLTPHHHPWRHLREWLPDWELRWCRMDDDDLGRTDLATRTIWLDERLLQAQARTTLMHELVHVRRQDECRCNLRDEALIEQYVARVLIPLDRLIDALKWARTACEAADELWVDLACFQTRMQHLHPAECGAVRAARAQREESA